MIHNQKPLVGEDAIIMHIQASKAERENQILENMQILEEEQQQREAIQCAHTSQVNHAALATEINFYNAESERRKKDQENQLEAQKEYQENQNQNQQIRSQKKSKSIQKKSMHLATKLVLAGTISGATIFGLELI